MTKNIPPRDRLIFALDVPTSQEAKNWVALLGETVTFYKLGLELLMSGSYFELIDWLLAQDKRVFADLKFFDVPQTVAAAVRQLNGKGISFTSVHGNDAILKAACEHTEDVGVLAVTVLTSLDQNDLQDLGFKTDPQTLVLSRARRALSLGCAGVVSSGLEAPALRHELGNQFLIVTPGIRPIENRPVDDQKRSVDVEQALRNGADYIVVGRPIREAPDPRAAAEDIQRRVAAVLADR
ncbi:MAG: orotidine-5'-phosphate decarboxylase [Gammaproteobacteria bacterium]